MEDGGNHVEILGSRFPAVNIQIWEESPELEHHNHNEHECTYGIYFEMMFESGTNLVICQEAATIANNEGTTTCPNSDRLDHFLVQEYHKDTLTQDPSYDWHCSGEEELALLLQTRMKNTAIPTRISA